MKVLLVTISLLISQVSFAHFKATTIYPEAIPCNPAPYGNYCHLKPTAKPNWRHKYPAYCGSTLVYLTKRQYATLNAMLRENRNVVIRYTFDGEYINAPCF